MRDWVVERLFKYTPEAVRSSRSQASCGLRAFPNVPNTPKGSGPLEITADCYGGCCPYGHEE